LIKQLANPVFSFISGWLGNKNQQSTAFGKHLGSKLGTTKANTEARPESFNSYM
jgi:hypothetical protein